MAKKKESLSDAKRKSVNRRRFFILFIIWIMFIGLFAGIVGNALAENEIARIAIIVSVCVATVIYWTIFFIIFRRERQKEKE